MDNFISRKKRPCPGTGEGDVNVSQTAQPIVKQQRSDTAEAASAVIKEYPKADNFVDDIPFYVIVKDNAVADDMFIDSMEDTAETSDNDNEAPLLPSTSSSWSSATTATKTALIQRQAKIVKGPNDISQYPDDGPTQPTLKTYPRTMQSSAMRSFQGAWYSLYSWLEYSIAKDASFCYACRHFSPTNVTQAETAFTSNGYSNWKKAMYKDGGFISHVKSDVHSIAMVAWSDFKSMAKKGTSIAQMVSEAYLKQVSENRQYIQSLREILLLTATQDIAQRGHRENPESRNAGNFLEILHLVGKYNPVIATKLKDLPGNAKYCSPKLQNEMLETLAEMIRN